MKILFYNVGASSSLRQLRELFQLSRVFFDFFFRYAQGTLIKVMRVVANINALTREIINYYIACSRKLSNMISL